MKWILILILALAVYIVPMIIGDKMDEKSGKNPRQSGGFEFLIRTILIVLAIVIFLLIK